MKDEITAIESLRSRLLWNELVFRMSAKGVHEPRLQSVSPSLYPELTIGKYEALLIELLDLEKAHPDFDPESQTYHPISGFICGLSDSESPVDQDFLSDFTEFLLDLDDNPSDADKWLQGLIFDFRSADQSHFQSILNTKWSDYVMDTRPGWWVGLGKEKQNLTLVELFSRKDTTRKSTRPKYAIGVETLLDDGTLDGYQDESGQLMTLYDGKDTEVYHCLLIFQRNSHGVEIAKRTYKRLA